MILLYPVVLIAAGYLMWRERRWPKVTGPGGFAVWLAAGALFFFSLLTGFSIGLLILPAAAGAVIFAAAWAPGPREATGFLGGVGAICLLVAFINRHSADFYATPWLIVGLLLLATAFIAFALSTPTKRALPGV